MRLEEFIKTQIESLDELRALLLLCRNPQLEWSANDVAGRLYLPPKTSGSILSRLVGRKLLRALENGLYRYEPQSPELAQLVEELSELDKKQPVTLINMVYAKPQDIQAFADAFKIKKEKD